MNPREEALRILKARRLLQQARDRLELLSQKKARLQERFNQFKTFDGTGAMTPEAREWSADLHSCHTDCQELEGKITELQAILLFNQPVRSSTGE